MNDHTELRDDLIAVAAERDALAAKVERVRALIVLMDLNDLPYWSARLRAALDGAS